MDKYSLREATEQDLHFCMNLHHKAYRVYVTAIWGWDDEKQNEMFKNGFRPENTKIVTLVDSDIGFYHTVEQDGALIICDIIIAQDYQGFGIGSSIIKEVIEIGKQKKMPICLGVFKLNQRAMKLYRCLGFKVLTEENDTYMMKYEV